jgi:plastocyanin
MTVSKVDIVGGASNPNNLEWYKPQVLSIEKGASVNWTNNDASLHTVTSGSFFAGVTTDFNSGIMNPGDSYQIQFNSTKTYNYFCTLHPFMFGTIDVR